MKNIRSYFGLRGDRALRFLLLLVTVMMFLIRGIPFHIQKLLIAQYLLSVGFLLFLLAIYYSISEGGKHLSRYFCYFSLTIWLYLLIIARGLRLSLTDVWEMGRIEHGAIDGWVHLFVNGYQSYLFFTILLLCISIFIVVAFQEIRMKKHFLIMLSSLNIAMIAIGYFFAEVKYFIEKVF